MTYAEKLKDPRWQRKRLEVLEANGFTCSGCFDHEKTLHVHHCYYEKGLMPWEYPDNAYKCLCERCHKARQENELVINRTLSTMSNDELEKIWNDVFFPIAISRFSRLRMLVESGELKGPTR